MKLLIATPLYPPEIGGPATYAKGLEDALCTDGHEVMIVNYGSVMRFPIGIRQLIFFLKILKKISGSDAVIALDTLSIGLPAMFLATIFRIPGIIRISGDQLWEHYVNRTGEPIPFPEFYGAPRSL